MKTRDFLPGEPVVGDVVVCTDGRFSTQTRLQRDEVPEEGRLYRVRHATDDHHAQWGFHEVIRLTAQDANGEFNRLIKGPWSASRFKATHNPQNDWSQDPYADCFKDETGEAYPIVKVRHLLWLARQCPAWRQLCQSNMGLALALAVLHPWKGDDLIASRENLRTAASMRRLEICRLLGFPASSSSLRVLSRLHQSWWQALDTVWLEGLLLALRQLLNYEPGSAELLLRHDAVSRAHFKRLAFGPNEIGLPDIFFDEPEILRGAWFFRLPMARRHWLTAELEAIEKRERATPSIALLPERRRLGVFQREKDAVAYLVDRQRLLDHLNCTIRGVVGGKGPPPWPEPPLPESDLIKPITSSRELIQEGKSQRHCIATYADHIAVGVYFAYRMTGPTRCTVGLKWDGQRWALDQICGGANSRIEEKQTKLVHDWMGSHADHAAVLRSDVAREVSRLIRLPKRPRPDLAATSRQPDLRVA